MLDRHFCEVLEYKITAVLANAADKKIKGFWCDGILLSAPDNHYSKKFINDNRQTTFEAYFGQDGQTLYTLILYFGPKSLSRYARDLDIMTCVPETDLDNWLFIDTETNTIEIQLD